MKRKRAIKLLMAAGWDRNDAEHYMRHKPMNHSNDLMFFLAEFSSFSPLLRVERYTFTCQISRRLPEIDEMRWYHRSSN